HGRALVAEDDQRRGVTDEDEVDPCVLCKAGARCVVRRHHRDLLAAALHRGELGQRQFPCWWSAHELPPSSGTLSMRRMPPTRTAAARTRVPSSSKTST